MTEQMSEKGNDVNDHNLNVGQVFNDYETLATSFNAFCKENYHPFVIRTRSHKQIIYKCCHGVKQTSKSQGIRPNQHYNFKGCQAQINFYKGKNEKWRLTKMLIDHNHTVGKEEYSCYSKTKKLNENENEYDTAMDMLFSSAQDGGMMAAVLSKKMTGQLDNLGEQEPSNSCSENGTYISPPEETLVPQPTQIKHEFPEIICEPLPQIQELNDTCPESYRYMEEEEERPRKTKKLNHDYQYQEMQHEYGNVANNKTYDEENEFEVFGRNVALQLQKLPLKEALEAQEQIQRVLKEFRIRVLESDPL